MSFEKWKEDQERIHNDYDAENAWYAGAASRQEEIDELKSKLKAINEFQNKIYDELVLFNPEWELVFNKLEDIEDLSKGELDEE